MEFINYVKGMNFENIICMSLYVICHLYVNSGVEKISIIKVYLVNKQ